MAPRKSRRTDAKGSPSLDTATEVDLNTNSPVQQQSPPDSESLAAGSSADPTLAADTDAHLKRWDELELEGVRVEVELEEWAKSEKQSWSDCKAAEASYDSAHEALAHGWAGRTAKESLEALGREYKAHVGWLLEREKYQRYRCFLAEAERNVHRHHATILEWEIQHEALNARGAFERPDNRRTVVPG